MREMTHDEWRAFLSQGTRTGMLATVRSSGRPHVAPVWFVLEGDDVVFTTAATSVKGRSVQSNPDVCIAVDDPTPPYAFVMIEGIATITEDPDELLWFATQIGGRYMGADRAEEYGRRNGAAGERLVRITPVKVVAHDRIAD